MAVGGSGHILSKLFHGHKAGIALRLGMTDHHGEVTQSGIGIRVCGGGGGITGCLRSRRTGGGGAGAAAAGSQRRCHGDAQQQSDEFFHCKFLLQQHGCNGICQPARSLVYKLALSFCRLYHSKNRAPIQLAVLLVFHTDICTIRTIMNEYCAVFLRVAS